MCEKKTSIYRAFPKKRKLQLVIPFAHKKHINSINIRAFSKTKQTRISHKRSHQFNRKITWTCQRCNARAHRSRCSRHRNPRADQRHDRQRAWRSPPLVPRSPYRRGISYQRSAIAQARARSDSRPGTPTVPGTTLQKHQVSRISPRARHGEAPPSSSTHRRRPSPVRGRRSSRDSNWPRLENDRVSKKARSLFRVLNPEDPIRVTFLFLASNLIRSLGTLISKHRI